MKCSLRERGQISFHIERSEIFHNMRVAYYFTFCNSKTFHLYAYHPTIHLRGVTHYTLQARCAKKSTNKNIRTPFIISVGQNLLYGRNHLNRSFFTLVKHIISNFIFDGSRENRHSCSIISCHLIKTGRRSIQQLMF